MLPLMLHTLFASYNANKANENFTANKMKIIDQSNVHDHKLLFSTI